MTPRGTRGLCSVHITLCERKSLAMLCSHCRINEPTGWLHITVYLVVIFKTLDIFQRVTNSQKVQFSSPNGLQDFITSNLG